MKAASLSLCTGLMMLVAGPCRAQQSPATEPAAAATPLMLVYVAKPNENVLPRIALGLEKPALRISAPEKCVRLSTANPKLTGIAMQLKAEDTKTLVAAIKALGAPDARELPDVVVWFATPDNKALDYFSTNGSNIEGNLVRGVLMFDVESEEPIVRYLDEKLHPL